MMTTCNFIIIVFLVKLANCCFEEKYSFSSFKQVVYRTGNAYNCTWTIIAEPNVKTTIRILNLMWAACREKDCCKFHNATISSAGRNVVVCHQGITGGFLLFEGEEIKVELFRSVTEASIKLEYNFRNATECPTSQFQCFDKGGCYNSSDVCNNRLDCLDHSDEIGCSNCAVNLAPCDTTSSVCYDPIKQRCDGILQCPNGDDEYKCSKSCPQGIQCQKEATCITTNQICDHKKDCANGFDENTCDLQFCTSLNYFLCDNGNCIKRQKLQNGIDDCGDSSDELNRFNVVKKASITFLMLLLSLAFFGIILHWCINRRDVNGLMQNLPEFPLPPFRGPGESDYNGYELRVSESDFMVGGEIYEGFARARRRNETCSGQRSRTALTLISSETSFSGIVEDERSEVAKALFTLGVSEDMCLGLDGYYARKDHSPRSVTVYENCNFDYSEA